MLRSESGKMKEKKKSKATLKGRKGRKLDSRKQRAT